VTTSGVADDAEVFIISIKDKRVGSLGRNYFPEEGLEQLVRESEAACEQRPPSEDYMPLLEGEAVSGDWEAPGGRTGIEVFDRLVPELSRLIKQADSSDVRLFGFAEHNASNVYLATSTGLRHRHTQLKGHIEINAKSPDFSRSSWIGQVTKDFRDIDLSLLYRRLEQRLQWAEANFSLDPGRYQVLLEPSAVADMLIYSYFTSSARDADEGRTVFSKPGGGNRIGEKLFPQPVTIYSDVSEPRFEVTPFTAAVSSSSYCSVFDNGLSRSRTEWVKDGVLNALITTRHWAEKSGSRPVPFIDNLVFASDSGPDLDAMIASTERAILVTCLWYIRVVDPQTLLLTGLTRDGVYLVEDGKVRGAVNNFRYNMSPIDMLAQATEIGRSEPTMGREFGDFFSFAKTPPLRVENFNMSSVSQAT